MSWRASLKAGLKAVRNGVDYVNNGHRYERAEKHLTAAYAKLRQERASPAILENLARVCLWKGIAFNENLDEKNPLLRNDPAILEYHRGLHHIAKQPDVEALKMSLYNSLAVAHHHRKAELGRPAPSAPIPAISIRYYRMARSLYDEKSKQPVFNQLMAKIENNSGSRVLRSKRLIGGRSLDLSTQFLTGNVIEV